MEPKGPTHLLTDRSIEESAALPRDQKILLIVTRSHDAEVQPTFRGGFGGGFTLTNLAGGFACAAGIG
jgi:hypothetical protein